MDEQDNIKKFIQDNLGDFNSEEPSDKVWKGVKKSSSPNNYKQYLGIAASIIILIVGFIGLKTFITEPALPPEIVEVEKPQQLDEVKDIEVFYTTKVNEKIERLEKYEESKDLLDEVTDLKLEFEQLKTDMGVGADREKVLEAMIDNYRIRLMILEDLLEELDTTKQKNIPNEKHT